MGQFRKLLYGQPYRGFESPPLRHFNEAGMSRDRIQRRKFLKSDRTEQRNVLEVVRRLAMAYPYVDFVVLDERGERLRLRAAQEDFLDANLQRLGDVMGREFAENALKINSERDGVRLTGYAGLPTLNQGYARSQFLFVNKRPVRDPMLRGAFRAA